MHLEELAKRQPVDGSMTTDISDEQMVQFKQSLVETVASKYKTKKNRNPNDKNIGLQKRDSSPFKQENPPRKKAKFLKPLD